jgi:hypothetical protein
MSPRPRRHAIVANVDHHDERIVLETQRHRITGLLRLPRDGYRSRLTDYLNAPERTFLALTNVELSSLDGSFLTEHQDYIALSLNHIVLAMPAEDLDPE